MEVREIILDLANKASGTVKGSPMGITVDRPEYQILAPIVTDAQAEVALCLEVMEPMKTAKEVAPLCGKTVEETGKLLWELAEIGVCKVAQRNGEDHYCVEPFVPGIMEMMANNKELVAEYPIIAHAFDAYGKIRAASISNFPIGVGPMRVIPIESAIDGNSRRASYEEISGYLNKATKICVSDCSCRTVREVMGEGCGHLKEDMCIQLNEAADQYIRTGRAREITKEEAFEIIRRAEENGLMHSIPNMDGSGETHAICNCCGCSCLSIRNGAMVYNNDTIRSNYVAKVDKEKCVACGECVTNCPINALQMGQKLCSKTSVVEDITTTKTPRDNAWSKDDWNIDYRINRKNVVESGTSPCKTECPAHIGVQGYIKLASQGKYTEALELIKQNNPFPAVCGRICPRNCESACTRGNIDEPVAIDEIKKFIAEQDLNQERRFIPRRRHEYGKKIAVVGAGPSGLSCAYYLAVDGYKVTVFEKEKVLGGMLTLGIPSFRLEKNVINAEIDILKEMGVEFKTGIEVGKNVTLSDLREQGYEAFYLAIGAQAGRKLNLKGEDAQNVIAGVDFLRDVNLGKDIRFDGKVIVIGGGNVAIDVARAATRVGASDVAMYCLEALVEMPALPEEIEEAVSEGISICNSWGPNRIVTEDGRVTGVEFKKCISVFDQDGKFKPVYDESETIIVQADYVLLSVGQNIAWGDLLKESKVEVNPNNTVKADPFTLQTGEPDIFAGGDAFFGPKFAIDAIAQGKEAAISIHRFVHPGQSLIIGRDRHEYHSLDKENADFEGFDTLPRQKTLHENAAKDKVAFRDVRVTFTEEQIKKEAERCLGCGATLVDEYMCIGCGQCTTKCKFDAISLERVHDAEGLAMHEMMPVVMENAKKRAAKIAAKKEAEATK